MPKIMLNMNSTNTNSFQHLHSLSYFRLTVNVSTKTHNVLSVMVTS